MTNDYVCSNCGEPAGYDGRCGDGPYLTCSCTNHSRWINDGRGGYTVYLNDAQPISWLEYMRKKKPSQ